MQSQWETRLQCNKFSHWLGVYTEWSQQWDGKLSQWPTFHHRSSLYTRAWIFCRRYFLIHFLENIFVISLKFNWSLLKMFNICRHFFNAFFFIFILAQILQENVPRHPIDNTSVLVQIMAFGRRDDTNKPLPESVMMIQPYTIDCW